MENGADSREYLESFERLNALPDIKLAASEEMISPLNDSDLTVDFENGDQLIHEVSSSGVTMKYQINGGDRYEITARKIHPSEQIAIVQVTSKMKITMLKISVEGDEVVIPKEEFDRFIEDRVPDELKGVLLERAKRAKQLYMNENAPQSALDAVQLSI